MLDEAVEFMEVLRRCCHKTNGPPQREHGY